MFDKQTSYYYHRQNQVDKCLASRFLLLIIGRSKLTSVWQADLLSQQAERSRHVFGKQTSSYYHRQNQVDKCLASRLLLVTIGETKLTNVWQADFFLSPLAKPSWQVFGKQTSSYYHRQNQVDKCWAGRLLLLIIGRSRLRNAERAVFFSWLLKINNKKKKIVADGKLLNIQLFEEGIRNFIFLFKLF